MPKAEEFGFDPDTFPAEVESLVQRLEEHDPGGSFRSEALYYWEEACSEEREQRISFIAHAMSALRDRFRHVLKEIGE